MHRGQAAGHVSQQARQCNNYDSSSYPPLHPYWTLASRASCVHHTMPGSPSRLCMHSSAMQHQPAADVLVGKAQRRTLCILIE